MGYPVYLNGQFPGINSNSQKDTLSILIDEFRKSGKTDAQIYSILIGMGISADKAANGINHISETIPNTLNSNIARTFLQVIGVEENAQNKKINMKFSIENLVSKIHETKNLIEELNAANFNRYGFSINKINEILNESLLSLDIKKAKSILESINALSNSLDKATLDKSNAENELDVLKKQASSLDDKKNIIKTIDEANKKLNLLGLQLLNTDTDIDVDANALQQNNTVNAITESINTVTEYLNEATNSIVNINNEITDLKKQVISILGRKNILETVCIARQKLHEHAWIESVKELCLYFDRIKSENTFSMMLMESLQNMKTDKYTAFNAKPIDAIEKMIEEGEDFIKENYLTLKEFSWTIPLKNAISKIANALNEMTDSSVAVVQNIYSPVQENEDGSITISLFGKFYAVTLDNISEINENQKPNIRFLKTLDAMSMFSITNEGFVYHGKRKSLSLVENKIYVENTPLLQNSPEAIMAALQESSLTSSNSYQVAEKISFLAESIDTVKELDIFTSLVSKHHKHVVVNIAKLNENIFINRVNSSMNHNEIIKVSSAKVAQSLVNEYINFDITPIVKEMLSREERHLYNINIEKNKLQESIEILEDKKKEILANIVFYPKSEELKELYDVVNSEINNQEKQLQLIYHQEGKGN